MVPAPPCCHQVLTLTKLLSPPHILPPPLATILSAPGINRMLISVSCQPLPRRPLLTHAGADPDRVIREIEQIIGLDCSTALRVSAKVGIGIEETLEAVVKLIPPPRDTIDAPLRALIFDSYYDAYRGVVCQFRVMDGCVRKGDTVVMMNTGKEYQLDEVGVLAPYKVEVGRAAGRAG